MQSAVHELSHGGKPSKERFKPVIIGIGVFVAGAVNLSFKLDLTQKFFLLSFMFLLFTILNFVEPKNECEPKNERKSDIKYTYKPYYGANRAKILIMLRNIEKAKKHV